MLVPAEGDGGNNDGAPICVGPRDVKRQSNNNRMKQSSTALAEHLHGNALKDMCLTMFSLYLCNCV